MSEIYPYLDGDRQLLCMRQKVKDGNEEENKKQTYIYPIIHSDHTYIASHKNHCHAFIYIYVSFLHLFVWGVFGF